MKMTNAVLITGAAKRLGKAMALAVHEQGYNVLLHYNHSEKDAKTVCDHMNAKRANSALMVQANLNDSVELKKLCERVSDSVRELKLLINNASQFYPTPVASAEESDWQMLMDSNVKAPFFLSKNLYPLLQEARGSIVNIVDIYGERPLKKHSIYSMSKAALLMQTLSLALEFAPDIRVNGIAPGAILWPEGGQSNQADILKKVALKRQGTEQDIVTALLYLLKAEYVTGQIIQVDGGRTLNL